LTSRYPRQMMSLVPLPVWSPTPANCQALDTLPSAVPQSLKAVSPRMVVPEGNEGSRMPACVDCRAGQCTRSLGGAAGKQRQCEYVCFQSKSKIGSFVAFDNTAW
jgi:hypothetical protein